MPRQAKTWLISDTHWGHEEMIKLCGRPEDFGVKIKANLKRLVAPQDTLIHLGDVIFYNYPELKNILLSIPGRKVLVMGNHDGKTKGWYMNNGFDYCADMIVQDNIIFTHRPIQQFPSGVTINIHGHLHNTGHHPQGDWWKIGETHLLFVLEHHYGPIGLQEFLHANLGKQKYVVTHDREGAIQKDDL